MKEGSLTWLCYNPLGKVQVAGGYSESRHRLKIISLL